MKNGVNGMRAMVKAGAAVMTAVLLMGGCANQQRLDQAMDENRSLKNSNNELQGVNAQLRAENELLQKQRSANEAALASANALANELKGKLGLTEEEYKTLLARLDNMKFGEIDPLTDKALRDLAAAHPDLITYDSDLGRLRFASDLTFDSGQDRVKEGAAQSLAALARILKSGPASGYEVMIVGHTDAQKISSGTAQRHPTNMHLSCHRAIAVRQALAGQGVSEDKMYAAGWGEQRPIASAGPKGESQANRRVEIYLTKSTAMAGAASTPAPTKVVTEPDMTK
jgi:chemotaxis protein MotB